MPGLLYEPFDSSTTIISDISSNEHSEHIEGRSTMDIVGSIIGFIVFFAVMYFVYRWFIKPHIKRYRRKILDKQHIRKYPRKVLDKQHIRKYPRKVLDKQPRLPQKSLSGESDTFKQLMKPTTGHNLFEDESDPHTAEIIGQDPVQDPLAITIPTKKTISTFSPQSISITSKMQPQQLSTDFCKSEPKIGKLKDHFIKEHSILSKLKTELNSLKPIVPKQKFHVDPILSNLETLSTDSQTNLKGIDEFLKLYKDCK
jgi:hypothetical protein